MEVTGTFGEPNQDLFVIEYPGYIRNTDRALETMGGTTTIAQVEEAHRSTINSKLAAGHDLKTAMAKAAVDSTIEVRFRPHDPYCHPTLGDRRLASSLVLRVSAPIAVPADSFDREDDEEEEEQGVKTEVLGTVGAQYVFNGLADLQYNSLTAPPAKKWAQDAVDETATALKAAVKKNKKDRPTAASIAASKIDEFLYGPQPLLVMPEQFAKDEPFEGYNFKPYRYGTTAAGQREKAQAAAKDREDKAAPASPTAGDRKSLEKGAAQQRGTGEGEEEEAPEEGKKKGAKKGAKKETKAAAPRKKAAKKGSEPEATPEGGEAPDLDQDGERREAAAAGGASTAAVEKKGGKKAAGLLGGAPKAHPVEFYDKEIPTAEAGSEVEKLLQGGGAAAGPSTAAAAGGHSKETAAQHALELCCRALQLKPIWHPISLWRHITSPPGRSPAGTAQPEPRDPSDGAPPHVTAAAFDRAVQHCTYRFKNGPWKGLVVRLGYDPRTEAGNLKYQGVDLTLPQEFVDAREARQGAEERERDKATPEDRTPPGGGAAAETVPVGAVGPRGGKAHRQVAEPQWPDVLRLRTLPASRTVTLQLSEIEDEEVKAALAAAEPSPFVTLDQGWLQAADFDRVANLIRERFAQILREQEGVAEVTAAMLSGEQKKGGAAGARKRKAADAEGGGAGNAKKRAAGAGKGAGAGKAPAGTKAAEAVAEKLLGKGAVATTVVAQPSRRGTEGRRGMEDGQGWVGEDELLMEGGDPEDRLEDPDF